MVLEKWGGGFRKIKRGEGFLRGREGWVDEEQGVLERWGGGDDGVVLERSGGRERFLRDGEEKK